MIMKTFSFILFILCLTQLSKSQETTTESIVLKHSSNDILLRMVDQLLSKFNTLFNETAHITPRIDALDERFEELNRRINTISQDISNFKTDINTRVQIQANVMKNDLDNYWQSTQQQMSSLKNDLTNAIQGPDAALRNEINARLGEMSNKFTSDLEKMHHDILNPPGSYQGN